MKRSEFLRKIGIGAVSIVVAPKVIAGIKPKDNSIIWDEEGIMPSSNFIAGCDPYKEGLSPIKVMKIHKQTGELNYPKQCHWDVYIDISGNQWIVTEIWPKKIVLQPLSVKQNKYGMIPNKMTIANDYIDKKFKLKLK